MRQKIRYRLGLDLGANSLGWCILELNEANEPFGIVRLGSRIFRDGRNPKDKTSLAVARRQARQQRRRRDRFLKRRDRLLNHLEKFGFLPEHQAERNALFAADPYALRLKGLDHELTPHEFGRAVFHLNQRRGFKSNRKLDKNDADESGKIKSAIAAAREAMQGLRTIGEWLALRHERRDSVRSRLQGQGAKAKYDLYIDRQMIADEFDLLYAKQASLQPSLFPIEAGAALRDILLFQRRLRPVKPGRCTLEPDEERAPLALPSSQRFRILQELNHLRVVQSDLEDVPLTLSQRDRLANELERKSKVSFDGIRRLLKLSGLRFNLESEKRDHLKGNLTTVSLSKSDLFGERWHTLNTAQQDDIVSKILEVESETELLIWLQEAYALPPRNAQAVANCGLPDGYGSLSRKALARINPCLQAEVIAYSDAVLKADYPSHSQFHDGEIHPNLPYYGQVLQRHVAFAKDNPKNEEERWGKIANPTVHIGLNQVRKVVNTAIARYGPPTEVVMEVARELKQSKDTKERIQKEQAANQALNDFFRVELAEMGIPANGENLLRMKLWRELNLFDPMNRCCPYTGDPISITRLFSPEVEIEHILPFSQTLDDSFTNKTVSLRRANRDKGNRTPHQAFGNSPSGYDWTKILERIGGMPKGKKDRFAVDAIPKWAKESKDFLARHLTDTQYLSRVGREYLTAVCPPHRVTVTPGRLTSLLRGKWGLNRILSDSGKKERTDHRHHAIDAAVIAVIDRGLLQKVATAAARAEELELDRLVETMPLPWESYRKDLAAAIEKVVTSYKPDHGWQGQLHNETAYGLIGNNEVVYRIPLNDIGFKSSSDFEKIRDSHLRQRLLNAAGEATGTDFRKKLQEFAFNENIHHVRVTKTLKTIPIRHHLSDEKPYKGYDGNSNYCIEIVRDEKGKWESEVISTFEANQIAEAEKIARITSSHLRNSKYGQSGRPLVMRLCIDDLVAMEEDGIRKIYRTAKATANGQIFFSEHHEANADARNRDKDDPFKYISKRAGSLYTMNARRVFVDPLGFVLDPGFKP